MRQFEVCVGVCPLTLGSGLVCRISCIRFPRCHLSKDILANGITAGRFGSEAILKVVSELCYPILGFLLHFKPQFAFCGARGRMFSFVAKERVPFV